MKVSGAIMLGYSWAIFGFVSAVLTALMMLMQEKMKIEPFALAFWCKVACVIALFPLVIIYGLPHDWLFYAWVAPTAVIFTIADVILFRHLPEIGAGVTSRVLPVTVIISFVLWFACEPSIITNYMAHPAISAMIALSMASAAFFSMRLRKCTVSMQALRLLWFVLCANVAGPLLTKAATDHAPPLQGGIAYTFIQAAMMIALWLCYLFIAKPMKPRDLLKKYDLQRGLFIGTFMAVGVTVYVMSVSYVDNPGYVSALRLVNTVLIVAAHRFMGKKDDSDLVSGFGIVASAAALVVLKAQF